MRRWSRVPPPPVERRPCDCEALAEQNAALRQLAAREVERG